jgi:hypothetical protein
LCVKALVCASLGLWKRCELLALDPSCCAVAAGIDSDDRTPPPPARRRRPRRLAPPVRWLAGSSPLARWEGGTPLLDKQPGEAPSARCVARFESSNPPLPRFRALARFSSPLPHDAASPPSPSSSEPRVAAGAGRTSRAPAGGGGGGGGGKGRARAARTEGADEPPPRRRGIRRYRTPPLQLDKSTCSRTNGPVPTYRTGPGPGSTDRPGSCTRAVLAGRDDARTSSRFSEHRGRASPDEARGTNDKRRGPPAGASVPRPTTTPRRRRRPGLPSSRRRLGRHPSHKCERHAALPDHAHFSEGDTYAIHDLCGVSRVIYFAVAPQLL